MKNTIVVADRLIMCNINNNMAGKTTLAALLLIGFFLLPAAAFAAERTVGPALGLGVLAAVAVADDPLGGSPDFFTPKAQAAGAVRGVLDIPLFAALKLGIGFQLHGTTISSYSGGWVYKSHWGGGLRLSAFYGFPLSAPSRPLRLTLGAGIGGSFNVDLYTFTTLFFFYPGIFVEPYLELDHSKRTNSSLTLVMPIDYYFRRDLGFYGSIGVGVIWRYTWNRHER
jgi:hypothetical protein